MARDKGDLATHQTPSPLGEGTVEWCRVSFNAATLLTNLATLLPASPGHALEGDRAQVLTKAADVLTDVLGFVVRVRAEVDSQVRAEVEKRVRSDVFAEVTAQVRDEVETQVQAIEALLLAEPEAPDWAEVEAEVRAEFEERGWSKVWAEVERRVGGNIRTQVEAKRPELKYCRVVGAPAVILAAGIATSYRPPTTASQPSEPAPDLDLAHRSSNEPWDVIPKLLRLAGRVGGPFERMAGADAETRTLPSADDSHLTTDLWATAADDLVSRVELRADLSPRTRYNIGCYRTGRQHWEGAVDALELALAASPMLMSWARRDPTLESLRRSDQWPRLLAAIAPESADDEPVDVVD
jgi:hypothetical protein